MQTQKNKFKKCVYLFIQSLLLFQVLIFVTELIYPYLPGEYLSVEDIMLSSKKFHQQMQYIFYGYSLFFISSFFVFRSKRYFLSVVNLFLALFSFLFGFFSTRGYNWYFGVNHRVFLGDSIRLISFFLLLLLLFQQISIKKYKNAGLVLAIIFCIFLVSVIL